MQGSLEKVLSSLFESAKKSTVQLFHNDRPEWENSRPEPVGSGVFIQLEGNYYIITAAHVVQGYAQKQSRNPYRTEDDYDDSSEAYLTLKNIGVYYNHLYYPAQHVVFTNTEDGAVENNVDIAVLFLDIESAEELKKSYTFITIDRMIENHSVNSENRYFIYGYPSDWTDLKASGIIKTTPFMFVTKGILEQESINCHYDQRYNMLLSYNKGNITSSENEQSLENFSPKGISGCGLWYFDGGNSLKLIGIMIEDKSIQERKPLMMATRIDEAMYIIRKVGIKEGNP